MHRHFISALVLFVTLSVGVRISHAERVTQVKFYTPTELTLEPGEDLASFNSAPPAVPVYGIVAAPVVDVAFGRDEDYIGVDVTGKIVIMRRGNPIGFDGVVNLAASHGAIGVIIYNNQPSGVFNGLFRDQTLIPAVMISDPMHRVLVEETTTNNYALTAEITDIEVVPEPASIALLGLGGLLLGRRRGR